MWLLQAPAGGQGMSTMIMMGLMFAVLYFVMIRPQQKQQKELQKMRNALKKGDKIITSGGMRGKVEAVKEIDGQSIVVVMVDDNVKIEFLASAITTVVRPPEATPEKASKSKEKTEKSKEL